MTRVMSIWFPQLPLDLWARRSDPRLDGHFAITREIKNALRITHMTSAASSAGVAIGQSMPDARAVCPQLMTEKLDEDRTGLLLRALWRWSDKLSPWAALDAPDGLYSNISGCSHLFGGEVLMANFALESLSDMHIAARIGIADTKQAAWALARYGNSNSSIIAPGQTSRNLALLPVSALNIPPKTITGLRRTGLKTIGDLYSHKTSELARRFGLELTQKLSCALGHKPDPVSPQAAETIYAARMSLPDPIGLLSDLNAVLMRLSESICRRLKQDQMGARRFELTIRCPDKGHHKLNIGFARPCYEDGAVLQQFSRPVEALKFEYGADSFRLVACNLEPVRERQCILGGEAQALEEDYEQLISTLGNRLGFDRVRKLLPQDYHLPELAFKSVEAVSVAQAGWPSHSAGSRTTRPFRIFKRPERLRTLTPGRPPQKFEWRQVNYISASFQGPERLAPPWWQARDNRLRDYWTMQTQEGPRFWLMTYPGSERPDWFIAGRFV